MIRIMDRLLPQNGQRPTTESWMYWRGVFICKLRQ